MSGFEYQDVVKEVEAYRNRFGKVYLSAPLLDSDADYDAVIAAIAGRTAAYDDQKTAICFMGHGTEADSNRVYAALQEKIRAKGYGNHYIGTVEATPAIQKFMSIMSRLRSGQNAENGCAYCTDDTCCAGNIDFRDRKILQNKKEQNMQKKWIAGCLIVLGLLGLYGCGSTVSVSGQQTATEPAAEETAAQGLQDGTYLMEVELY